MIVSKFYKRGAQRVVRCDTLPTGFGRNDRLIEKEKEDVWEFSVKINKKNCVDVLERIDLFLIIFRGSAKYGLMRDLEGNGEGERRRVVDVSHLFNDLTRLSPPPLLPQWCKSSNGDPFCSQRTEKSRFHAGR